MDLKSDLFRQPQRMTALCGTVATGLGLIYLAQAGAPFRYLWMNGAALALGLLLSAAAALAGRGRIRPDIGALAIGAVILAGTLFGATVDGATRWVMVGGLFLQPSILLLPLMMLCVARAPGRVSSAAVGVAALALALQPDRAMAGALAAATLALTAVRRDRAATVPLAAALIGFAATLTQPDDLPAVRYVEQVLAASLGMGWPTGLAVLGGASLLILPAVAGYACDVERRAEYLAFGMLWLAVIVASAMGNYPTPVVGYGASAIIGYTLCLIGFSRRVATARTSPSGAIDQSPPYERRVAVAS